MSKLKEVSADSAKGSVIYESTEGSKQYVAIVKDLSLVPPKNLDRQGYPHSTDIC
jgi:hypothetical protein